VKIWNLTFISTVTRGNYFRHYILIRSGGTSVSKVSAYGLHDRSSIPGTGKKFFF
jgi:hypothetical protein